MSPSDSIGQYRVLDKLGEGGMGQVYRARDSKLNREVALKVLPASFAADPERVSRFEREAQLLAALNHPNVAAIYGVEPASSGHGDVLVMELVSGPTLAELLAEAGAPDRGLPMADALRIARQLVDALDAAHERGIIHRDLKPANIKVREDGTVKVLDFGLAKALAPDQGDGSGSRQRDLSPSDAMNSPTLTAQSTALGVILGTAAYMSPEQARGRPVDKRADIWAFGAVLYEMLTGRRAFPGEGIAETLAAVLRQEVDWQALPPETPPAVRQVLARCLDRDFKRRLRDIADAHAAFEAPPSSTSSPAIAPASTTVAMPKPANRSWMLYAAMALLTASNFVWLFLLVSKPPAPPALITRAMMTTAELDLFPSLSRDGVRMTYSAVTGQGQAHVGVRRLDEFAGTLVPGAEGAFSILSPDGQWVAYQSLGGTNTIRKIAIAGGTPVDLCPGSLATGGVWLADDTIIFAGQKGLMRVGAAGGTAESLTTVNTANGERSHSRPSLLPDAQHILFTVNTAKSGDVFAVLDLSTHKYQTVGPGGDNGQYAASGHLLYVRGTTLFATPFDASRLVVTGAEVPVVPGVSTIGPDGTANFTVSNAGLLVYGSAATGKGTTLAWADARGATTPLPGQSRASWGRGRLSPDGTRVADSIRTDNGTFEIWTLDVARGTATQLTSGLQGGEPIWTSDSRRIVFDGQHNGHPALFVVPADSSEPAQVLAEFDSDVAPVAVSPDGRTLLADVVGSDKRPQIMAVPLDANARAAGAAHPWHETTAIEGLADFSPDGKWVAYESMQSGALAIYVQAALGTGARVRVSDAGGTSPRWSRNARQLYYWGNVPTSRLQVADVTPGQVFAPGAPRDVFRLLSGTTWDVTADPNRFLVELTTPSGDSTMAVVTNWFDELRRLAPPRK